MRDFLIYLTHNGTYNGVSYLSFIVIFFSNKVRWLKIGQKTFIFKIAQNKLVHFVEKINAQCVQMNLSYDIFKNMSVKKMKLLLTDKSILKYIICDLFHPIE